MCIVAPLMRLTVWPAVDESRAQTYIVPDHFSKGSQQMKQLFGVIAAVLAAMPVSAAWFGQSTLYGPNFVVLGDFIDYTISVSAAATAAPSATIVDPLPPGLEFVGGSLACSGGSGSCSYDGPTRTVSWAGSLAAWQTVTISFSVTTTALAGPGYVTNEAIADDPGLDALVLLRTSCVHYPEEQMLLGPIASVAPHGSGFAMTQGSGVAWNAAVENYLTAWISTNSSVYDVQVRTVDPSGALGVVRSHHIWAIGLFTLGVLLGRLGQLPGGVGSTRAVAFKRPRCVGPSPRQHRPASRTGVRHRSGKRIAAWRPRGL